MKEPHQGIGIKQISVLAQDDQLCAWLIELEQTETFRSNITTQMVLQTRKGVTSIKHKRKSSVITTNMLAITRTLGGTVVSAVDTNSNINGSGMNLTPLLSVSSDASKEISHEELIATTMIRREAAELPEKVTSTPVTDKPVRKRNTAPDEEKEPEESDDSDNE